MGTLVEIGIETDDRDGADATFAAAFAEIDALESVLSAHRPDSVLNRLCALAHAGPQPAPPPLLDVLRAALDLNRRSQGIFEVVRGAADGPAAAASSADIGIDDDGRVSFRRPLRLDLGGIAKGCVVDRVVDLLRARGIRGGCVNAGGDLRVFGDASEPVCLRFGDGFRTIARLRDGAFAASRPGPRPFSREAADVVRHFDGRSGSPVRDESATIAVFAPTAMIADALAKIALVSAATMDAIAQDFGAEWRRLPFLPAMAAEPSHAA